MDREERIRQRAHEIWEREGRPEGREQQHWYQALEEITVEEEGSLSSAGRKIRNRSPYPPQSTQPTAEAQAERRPSRAP